MDVKSVFLNDILHEEIFVEKSKGFEDPHFPNHVYKLNKILFRLKHPPQAWYERLTNFLIEKGYKRGGVDKTRGGVDKTLFIMHFDTGIIIAQIYVDDIVFGSTSHSKVHQPNERKI